MAKGELRRPHSVVGSAPTAASSSASTPTTRAARAPFTPSPPPSWRARSAPPKPAQGALFGVTAEGERPSKWRSVLHRRDGGHRSPRASTWPPPSSKTPGGAPSHCSTPRPSWPPLPAADDKELAAWNGLALMALADAARTLGEPRCTRSLQRTARFLVGRCWDAPSRTLRRGARGAALPRRRLPRRLRPHRARPPPPPRRRRRPQTGRPRRRHHRRAVDALPRRGHARPSCRPPFPTRPARFRDGGRGRAPPPRRGRRRPPGRLGRRPPPDRDGRARRRSRSATSASPRSSQRQSACA